MSFLNCDVAKILAICLTSIGVPICIILLYLPAWYGRYTNNAKLSLGSLPAKVAWFSQECPSFLIPFICLWVYQESLKTNWVNGICLSFYLFHYLYRSFIYPFRIRNGKRTPTEIWLMAVVFCVLNGYIQATYNLTPCVHRSVSWLTDLRFITGTLLFLIGMGINWHSDAILRSLRNDQSDGYKIPYGGMFEYVSGANYFGECIEWIGYSILSWNFGALSFAIFTCANIGPRAVQHHKWYKKTFGDMYPSNRKAIIPFVYYIICSKQHKITWLNKTLILLQIQTQAEHADLEQPSPPQRLHPRANQLRME